MDALVYAPEMPDWDGRVVTLRQGEHSLRLRFSVPGSVALGRPTTWGDVVLTTAQFRAGTRAYWVLLEREFHSTSKADATILDMLIDLAPEDVKRIRVQ